MSTKSRRIGLALVIVACVVAGVVALLWFVIAPGIIQKKANEALAALSEKTHRVILVKEIGLRGLKHVHVDEVQISERDNPDQNAVTVRDIDIRLSGVPASDFSVSSVDVGELAVQIRRDENGTNFDDVLQKLGYKN